MSGKQLVEYMKNPFDKNGDPVPADTVASPTTYDFFNKFGTWAVNKDTFGSDASVSIEDHNTMTVDFTIGTKNDAAGEYPFVDVATYFEAGAFENVSHIDIVYETQQPVRVRLITPESGPLAMQVLLAGVGGERIVRIRAKDFMPDPYAEPAKIAAQGFVDKAYMAKVVGLSFESACVKDKLDFQLKIKRIDIHGLSASAKPALAPQGMSKRVPTLKPAAAGSSKWPVHRETSSTLVIQ
jgi:hypothetical protein